MRPTSILQQTFFTGVAYKCLSLFQFICSESPSVVLQFTLFVFILIVIIPKSYYFVKRYVKLKASGEESPAVMLVGNFYCLGKQFYCRALLEAPWDFRI